MFEKQLTYDDLDIADKEIFIQMGYGENTPGEDILAEMNEMKATVRNILQPRFCFTVIEGGELNTEEKLLSVEGTTFSVGRIITSQLRGLRLLRCHQRHCLRSSTAQTGGGGRHAEGVYSRQHGKRDSGKDG